MTPTICQRPLTKLLFCTTTLAAALALTGCGGGDLYVDAPPFDIRVVIAGQPLSGVILSPGPLQRLSMRAGQSMVLSANEPVTWSLNVGGTTVSGPGVTVYYGDVAITLTELTASRVAIDTGIRYPLAAPLFITLVATSTYDFAQVSTTQIMLTP
jgi:hypothetical protein